jgi:hypothetical protein
VADKSKIPLYILGADDIGTSPEKVEQALKHSFECCRLWDALLLIDEADVFLETRRADHLSRNELVASKSLLIILNFRIITNSTPLQSFCDSLKFTKA